MNTPRSTYKSSYYLPRRRSINNSHNGDGFIEIIGGNIENILDRFFSENFGKGLFKYNRYGFRSLETEDSINSKYQLIAILLLTTGIIIVFQSFGQSITTDNIINQTKTIITRSENNQIESDIRNINGINQTVISMNPVAPTPSTSETNTTTNSNTDQNLTITSTPTSPKQINIPTIDYTVIKGDTLFGIALANQTSVQTLKELNQLENNTLRIGTTIKIPKNVSATSKSQNPNKNTQQPITPKK